MVKEGIKNLTNKLNGHLRNSFFLVTASVTLTEAYIYPTSTTVKESTKGNHELNNKLNSQLRISLAYVTATEAYQPLLPLKMIQREIKTQV